MPPTPSAEQPAMSSVKLARNAHAGVLDALANYWFKRLEFAQTGDITAPELNLEVGADVALLYCLKPYGVTLGESYIDGTFEQGFNTGLRAAAILVKRPFDAESALRDLLDELVRNIRESGKQASR